MSLFPLVSPNKLSRMENAYKLKRLIKRLHTSIDTMENDPLDKWFLIVTCKNGVKFRVDEVNGTFIQIENK